MQHLSLHSLAKINRKLICLSVLIGLTGCANFSLDHGFNAVQKTVEQHIQQTPLWANSEAQKKVNADQVKILLSEPLNIDSAVQIALLNNAQLQASFYQLQIAESYVVETGRLPNPAFSLLYAKNQGEYAIEQVLSLNLLKPFTLPKATAIEKKKFAQRQYQTAIEIVDLAIAVRSAYVTALAAKELEYYLSQVKDSTHATYVLAERMQHAGNWNTLELSREKSIFLEANIAFNQAKNQAQLSKETLTRLLGLKHPNDFMLPERLNDLPKSYEQLKKISDQDFANRLDLAQIRLKNETLAEQLGLTKATQWVNVLEIGPARVIEGKRDSPAKKGVELHFELPIFDWGIARVKRTEATYQQALGEASFLANTAASEVRSDYQQYVTNYEVAKQFRDEIIPLKKLVLQESVLRYNGMLISPFELMLTARDQVRAVSDYISALRDFWIAENNLTASLVGRPIVSIQADQGI